MKKIILITTISLLLSGITNARDIVFELKGSYFHPSEEAFMDIYGEGMMYGAEVSIGVWKNLKLWVEGSYFSKKGKLTFTKEKTNLRIIPIGGGVKYVLSVGRIRFYSGIGINYYLFKETSPIGEVRKGEYGILGKLGSYVKVNGRVMVNLYVDYSYCEMQPAEFRINIGGIKAGIGIGYEIR
ncbi:MAG: hypothetical protein KAU46_05910 [Candidatus Aminicenantes bacterium]|nr:hypothetical protein [Candidatus Aminicenantes bacterium]